MSELAERIITGAALGVALPLAALGACFVFIAARDEALPAWRERQRRRALAARVHEFGRGRGL